jgi:hypothetical protein
MGGAPHCALEQRQPLAYRPIEFFAVSRDTSIAGVTASALVLGLSTQTFTIIHVIISLLAIASGILVLVGMLRSNQMPGWTAFFLLTTILISVIAWTRALRALWQASLPPSRPSISTCWC